MCRRLDQGALTHVPQHPPLFPYGPEGLPDVVRSGRGRVTRCTVATGSAIGLLGTGGHDKGVDTTMAIRLALGVDAVFASGLAAETATWDSADPGRNVSKPIASSRWPTVVHRLGRDRFEAVSDRGGLEMPLAG